MLRCGVSLGADNLVAVSSVSGDPDVLELLRAAIKVMHAELSGRCVVD